MTSLINWLTYLLTEYWQLTDRLTAQLTDWLLDWLSARLPALLPAWLTDSPTDWLTDWLIDWLIDWLTDWLTDFERVNAYHWLKDWLSAWLLAFLPCLVFCILAMWSRHSLYPQTWCTPKCRNASYSQPIVFDWLADNKWIDEFLQFASQLVGIRKCPVQVWDGIWLKLSSCNLEWLIMFEVCKCNLFVCCLRLQKVLLSWICTISDFIFII